MKEKNEIESKLTIYYDEPFWAGVFERIDNGKLVPSPKKQTKNLREKPNEKNDKYNIKLLYPTAFIPRFA